MKDYQQRVVDEKRDLDGKLSKLDKFIGSADFSKVDGAEQVRLRKQSTFMHNYSNILRERIEAFPKEETK